VPKWASFLVVVWLWPTPAFGQFPLAVVNQQVESGGPPSATRSSADADAVAERNKQRLLEEAAKRTKSKTQPHANAGSSDATTGEPGHPPPGVVFNEKTQAEYQRAWQAYYAYRVDGYTHRQQVFKWQDVSTKVTFVVVIFLVLAGVYFAAVQFHVGMRAGRETGESGEVELTVKGIKVRSPVLGVIVLTISLAFFYLYLVYVYPIENVF